MDEHIIELLRRMNDTAAAGEPLTDDELREVRDALVSHARTVTPATATAEDIALLAEVQENLNGVREQLTDREAAAAERAAAAEALLADIAPEPEPAAEPETVEADTVEPVVAETEPVVAETEPAEPETVVVEERELVTAAAVGQPAPPAAPRALPRISRLAARRPDRAKPRPALTASAANGDPAKPVLLASADLPGLPAGAEIDPERWAQGAMRRFEAVRKVRDGGNDGEKVYFGTIKTQYPESRILGDDEEANQEKIDAVAGLPALVASGGICGPVAVDYNVTTIATAARPVQGAMAQFQATRGGLRYILPHTLAAVTADAPASMWTEGTDAAPGGATKPHATFYCQPVQEAYVDAVTSIVQFGNFQARYFPEQIAEYLQTVDAVHARLAEGNLLSQISAGSTQTVEDNYELGAARDLLAIIDRAAAAMRFRHRMAPETPLRLVYPEWLEDMVRADLARELPGDSGGQAERLAVTDAQIDNFFAVRNINVTNTQDSPLGAAVLQGWGIQGPGQLLPWPLQTYAWLYPEGSWMFLDGGELNLGMVRDSTLNRTNDFQMFSETFEKAIFRGHESLQLTLKLAPTGASAGTVAPTSGGAATIGS